ncbi:MAG: GNAT family N-acetyltransferase [Rhodospirillales bacterium]|nr:GNAT family N-acetyltransferase [Rhodospirillales bacterium]
MIRDGRPGDIDAIFRVINDAAEAYRGHIPADRLVDDYMPVQELAQEIAAGVRFRVFEDEAAGLAGVIAGVMGTQDVSAPGHQDVTLIRHAYVLSDWQGRGIGGKLLKDAQLSARRPLLIGAWAAAIWAVRFYQHHGFRLVGEAEKTRLLQTYWDIPNAQVEHSVVLVDAKWEGR